MNSIKKDFIWIGSFALVFLLLILYADRKKKAIFFITSLVVIDMTIFFRNEIDFIDRVFFEKEPEAAVFLKKTYPDYYDYKIWIWNRGNMYSKLKNSNGYEDKAGYYFVKKFMHMNNAAIWDLNNFEGDISIVYNDQIRFKNYIRYSSNYDLLSFYGIKFILTDSIIPDCKFRLVYNKNDVVIYENSRALPAFYCVAENAYRKIESFEKKIELIKKNTETPSDILIFDNNEKNVDADPFYHGRPEYFITSLKRKPDNIEFTLKSDKNAFLVYINSYHPGWKCIINGKQADIYKVNLTNMSVHIKKGTNHILFKFE